MPRRTLASRVLRHLVIVMTLLLFLGGIILGIGVAVGAPLDRDVAQPQADRVELLFFWGVGCPHCERAKPFMRRLDRERADVEVTWWEVKKDEEGRRRFIDKVRELKIDKPSVPTFVCGGRYVVGFREGVTEKKIRHLVDACIADGEAAP